MILLLGFYLFDFSFSSFEINDNSPEAMWFEPCPSVLPTIYFLPAQRSVLVQLRDPSAPCPVWNLEAAWPFQSCKVQIPHLNSFCSQTGNSSQGVSLSLSLPIMPCCKHCFTKSIHYWYFVVQLFFLRGYPNVQRKQFYKVCSYYNNIHCIFLASNNPNSYLITKPIGTLTLYLFFILWGIIYMKRNAQTFLYSLLCFDKYTFV